MRTASLPSSRCSSLLTTLRLLFLFCVVVVVVAAPTILLFSKIPSTVVAFNSGNLPVLGYNFLLGKYVFRFLLRRDRVKGLLVFCFGRGLFNILKS